MFLHTRFIYLVYKNVLKEFAAHAAGIPGMGGSGLKSQKAWPWSVSTGMPFGGRRFGSLQVCACA